MKFSDVSTALAEVASHYHARKPPAEFEKLRDWVFNLLHGIADFLRRLFYPHGSGVDSHITSEILRMVVIVASVAAAAAFLGITLFRLFKQRTQRLQLLSGADVVEAPLSAAGWKQKSAHLARQSDYRGACRAAYLSLLQAFAESGVAPFAPAKTNYEYGYALSGHPEIRRKFMRFAELIDELWFGNKQASEAEYEKSVAILAELDGDMRYSQAQASSKDLS